MKTCLECGRDIFGRSDKKYCCDECRVSSNNKKYQSRNRTILETNRILKRNYHILSEIVASGETSTNITCLSKKGYIFDLFTSLEYQNEKTVGFCCYNISLKFSKKGNIYLKRLD